MDRVKPLLWRHTWISWIFVGLLTITCAILALLQFRWIGEVSKAERQRLHEELTNKLNLLRRSFNEEIESAAAGLLPAAQQIEELGREPAYAEQYKRWEPSHERLFRRIALAVPTDGSVDLALLDFDQKSFAKAEWPAEWAWLRERMITRRMGGPAAALSLEESVVLESPRFVVGPDDGRGGGPPRAQRGSGRGEKGPPQPNRGPRPPEGRGGPQGPRGDEQEWLVMELNLDYLRSSLFPEMLNRYLGGAGKLEYDAEVVLNSNPSVSLFRTSTQNPNPTEFAADASVRILDIRPNIGRSQPGRGGRGPGPPGDPTQGRWLLQVRHHFGSLEAIVARARWRNVAISAGLLLMMLVTVFALLRISRSAQQLAELQMNFVAGVSHELRTPLTVMSTAAYNLRGKIAQNPAQVERYGTLIQEQCTRLTSIVEQVLLFARSKSGGVLREREPVDLTALIQDELQANRVLLEKSRCNLETAIEPGLPIVLGDATALRHAFQNLLTNAIKYGTEGSNWIGVFAAVVEERGESAVEIRVADRGPGIPREEQKRIFDPFFRGNRAVQDQIHGTGLGLNLVKRIVEAHGGSVSVRSEPMQQTEFVIRIPAAPHKIQDEVTHSFN